MKAKQRARRLFQRAGHVLGRLSGFSLRPFPALSRRMYRRAVLWNRRRCDRVTLWLHSFFSALGTAVCDGRGPLVERLRIPGGGVMDLDISEKTQRQIFSHKLFEASLSRFCLAALKSGDTFVDIGANVGYFTLLAGAAVGERGMVVALEPERRNFEALAHHVHENKYAHVRLFECAAGREEGQQTLHVHPLNRGGSSMVPFSCYGYAEERYGVEEMKSRFGESALSQQVSVRGLDGIFSELNITDCALMKIDVEGFEGEVLKGAQRIFADHVVKQVVCEVNNKETRSDIFAFFRGNGYAPYKLSYTGKPMPFPYETDLATIQGNVLFSVS